MQKPYSLFDVAGKVALIIGATGGFGHAASLGLAESERKEIKNYEQRDN